MKPNAKNVVSAEAISAWGRVRERKGPTELAPHSSQDPLAQVPGCLVHQQTRYWGRGSRKSD